MAAAVLAVSEPEPGPQGVLGYGMHLVKSFALTILGHALLGSSTFPPAPKPISEASKLRKTPRMLKRSGTMLKRAYTMSDVRRFRQEKSAGKKSQKAKKNDEVEDDDGGDDGGDGD